MQRPTPELLANTSESPQRAALENGYRWLRFEPGLEGLFEISYQEAHRDRVRLAGYCAMLLFACFVVIDVATLPKPVWTWTVSIRIALILVFAATTWLTHWPMHPRAYRGALVLASLTGTLGTVALIGSALRLGYDLPYEGILLAPMFVHLIICLPWWRALLVNVVTLLAFIGVQLLYQPAPQTLLYHVIFMCAATALAAYGGYFLEYSTRTSFLVNALLNELAERDGLTGLYNRRTLNTHLDRVWRQGLRAREGLAIAMIDVDHFKPYNDRYGHAQGDAALKAIAGVIAESARRPFDLAARYGGEEFIVVWYHPDPRELDSLGEQLRQCVNELVLHDEDGKPMQLSISVGVASIVPIVGQSWTGLLRVADAALFQAKSEGRNRVVAKVHRATSTVTAPPVGTGIT